MPTLDTTLLLAVMLLVAMAAEPLSRKLRLPFSAFLVLVGFLGSELILGLGYDTGLRAENFVDLVLHVLVPILVLESAFRMQFKSLLRYILPVLLLAVPLMLLSAAAIGGVLYLGINHPSFGLMTALLAGVILSATDPVAVVALFERFKAPERLIVLLEGESLFNDATAVVSFSLLVALLLNGASTFQPGAAALTFVWHMLGGIALGALIGGLAGLIYSHSKRLEWRGLLVLLTVPITYRIAEQHLQVSGIVSLLAAGLALGEAHRRHNGPQFVSELWSLSAYAANALVFLLAGATVTLAMFQSHWLAMLLGIGAAVVVRVAIIYLILPASMKLMLQPPIPASYKKVMQWGGLRGAVALALALSLPSEVEHWYTLQSVVYGVVLFTLFVQAPFLEPMVRRTLQTNTAAE